MTGKQTKLIGIIGGGQLGRMLTDAAHKLGFRVIILDPTPNSPAGQVADEQIVGSFKEKDQILKLAEKVDFMTFETESANVEALEEFEKQGKSVHPSSRVLKIIKDKFSQKAFLQNYGVPVAEFAMCDTQEDAVKQGEIFGYPFLLKARFDAYDGRGNFVVEKKQDIDVAFEKLGGKNLYAEKYVRFMKELSVVAARDVYGGVQAFPIVETIHKNNICHIVRSPAEVTDNIRGEALAVATQVLESLKGVGVFAIEMFLTKDGIIVNEIAPRVHNSGHHTIEAFSVSQFEEHIRAVTGLPIVTPRPTSPHAVMMNILGDRDGEAHPQGEEKAKNISSTLADVHIHIYGKMETRKERKMGHITVLAKSQEKAEDAAYKARKIISI